MRLVFVHGWAVCDTRNYGELPEALLAHAPDGLSLSVEHIFLSRYISFNDQVTVQDIARAFEHARRELLGDEPFSCIAHSTGAVVVRTWIDLFYGAFGLKSLPLQHFIMLAPANFGSALAQLGKSRVGRLRCWMNGREAGQRILDCLELGSEGLGELNERWLEYHCSINGFYPFVFTGNTHHPALVDYLNSYTYEVGSDGVVRTCAANLNGRWLSLVQRTDDTTQTRDWFGESLRVTDLVALSGVRRPQERFGFEVISDACHSGEAMGIMRSVTQDNAGEKPVVASIIDSLMVASSEDYRVVVGRMAERSSHSDTEMTMLVVKVVDDHGEPVSDYDFYLLAGERYSPNELPQGFFVDRQRNQKNGHQLTYYLNLTRLREMPQGKLGFLVVPRPSEGFVFYRAAEYRMEQSEFEQLFVVHHTLSLTITLTRCLDTSLFQVDSLSEGRVEYSQQRPDGAVIPPAD